MATTTTMTTNMMISPKAATSPSRTSLNPSNYAAQYGYANQSAGPSPPEGTAYYHSNKSSEINPTSQTPPSTNISPTNFPANPPRQLRQPRQPLYTPAALRPTDHVSRPTDIPGRPRALDTPPASKESSFDSGYGVSPRTSLGAPSAHNRTSSDTGNFGTGTSSELSERSLRLGLIRSTSAPFEEDLFLAASTEADNADPSSFPTAAPTTAHWKPDSSAPGCFICTTPFTWYTRRHHCRRCGNLVCDLDSQRRVPLDEHARLHPRGTRSRACDACWDEFAALKRRVRGRHSSSSTEGSQSTTTLAIPTPTEPIAAIGLGGFRKPSEARVGSMARSEGMVWSTF